MTNGSFRLCHTFPIDSFKQEMCVTARFVMPRFGKHANLLKTQFGTFKVYAYFHKLCIFTKFDIIYEDDS